MKKVDETTKSPRPGDAEADEEWTDSSAYLADFYAMPCRFYSASSPDWNDAFQRALELDDRDEELALRRQADLYRIESAFEKEVMQVVQRLVDEGGLAPLGSGGVGTPAGLQAHDVHQLQFRDGNIFYRVMKDVAAGRRYIQSLRGVLLSGTDGLTVPLSVLVVYRGVPVLGQALTDLGKDPAAALAHNDADLVNEEVAAELAFVSTVINVPMPVAPRSYVYSGRDGRRYLTATNVTTIPLDVSELEGPLQRAELLCSALTGFPPLPVSTSMDNAVNVLRQPAFIRAMRQIGATSASASLSEPGIIEKPETSAVTREDAEKNGAAVTQQCDMLQRQAQQERLCATLHYFGVNLILLPLVLETCRPTPDCSEAVRASWKDLKRVVAIELLARTIKKDFYLQTQARRRVAGTRAAEENMKQAVAWLLSSPPTTSNSGEGKVNDNAVTTGADHPASLSHSRCPGSLESCVDAVLRRFTTTTDVVSELAGALHYCREHCQEIIIARVCVLVGARADGSSGGGGDGLRLYWTPLVKGRLLPRLSDPRVQRAQALAAAAHFAEQEEVVQAAEKAGKKKKSKKGERTSAAAAAAAQQLWRAVYWNPLRARVLLWQPNTRHESLAIQREAFAILTPLVSLPSSSDGVPPAHHDNHHHHDTTAATTLEAALPAGSTLLSPVVTLTQAHGTPFTRLLYLRALFLYLNTLLGSSHIHHVVEGYSMIRCFLDGLRAQASWSAFTLAKYHIRIGCLLLGVTQLIHDAVLEASKHFSEAERLLMTTSRHQRGPCVIGARMYIQAGLGLLQCDLAARGGAPPPPSVCSHLPETSPHHPRKKEGRLPASVSLLAPRTLETLLERAMHLAAQVPPSESFAKYLWELGMELGSPDHQQYAESVKVLTRAVSMAKRLPAHNGGEVSAERITEDLMQMYRTWDEKKYGAYCTELTALMEK